MRVPPDAARALAISVGLHESASCIAVSHPPAWYQTVSAPVYAIQMEVPSARCAISQKNSRRDARRGVSTDPIHTIRVPLETCWHRYRIRSGHALRAVPRIGGGRRVVRTATCSRERSEAPL